MTCNFFMGITTHKNPYDFVTIDPVEVLTPSQIIKPAAGAKFSAIYGNLASGVGTDPDNIENVINIPDNVSDAEIFRTYNEDALVGGRPTLTAQFEMPSVDLEALPPRTMFNTTYDFSAWTATASDPSQRLASTELASGVLKGTYAPGKGDFTLTPANSGVYTSINLNKSIVTVQGNVALYVTGLDGSTGSFDMGVGSSITIAPNSSLSLILGKTTWNQANNTSINNTNAPTDLVGRPGSRRIQDQRRGNGACRSLNRLDPAPMDLYTGCRRARKEARTKPLRRSYLPADDAVRIHQALARIEGTRQSIVERH